ncbi:aspartate/glutamate racemase family protein [uncultured Desulfosarcina sp.]|uniref:aspartate/glutamate racemase family protein n=1 Tax=uncultured Desulfosarcina sp. TaxID=218289 RepID=UPI0029C685A2|nr:aspartate/glutamate racemase family protein [uncultured Desulfosarcina sp.]
MKTIGMIGGMSWESTLVYYRIINEAVRDRLGGLHSAKSILYSVDFAEIEALQHAGQWDAAQSILVRAAQSLVRAGADLLIICTNTMHKLADGVAASVAIPLLHIADPTAEAVLAAGINTVALLGTRFTMEEDFYRKRLEDRYGLRVLIPDAVRRQIVHDIIYTELCLGRTRESSRQAYARIIEDLVERGAHGVILGCTEIGLLVRADDCPVPVFDTARIHAEAAVNAALTE